MERKMYKADRQMTAQQVEEALQKGNHGTLSVNGDEGYPYAVPVNYVYDDGKIYIHSAKYGYKVECLEKDNKVCFSAIINAEVVPNMFTAAFVSVVATGKASFVEDDVKRREILEKFIYKMSPDFVEGGMKFVNGAFPKTLLICVEPEEIKGKQSMAEKFDVE